MNQKDRNQSRKSLVLKAIQQSLNLYLWLVTFIFITGLLISKPSFAYEPKTVQPLAIKLSNTTLSNEAIELARRDYRHCAVKKKRCYRHKYCARYIRNHCYVCWRGGHWGRHYARTVCNPYKAKRMSYRGWYCKPMRKSSRCLDWDYKTVCRYVCLRWR